jgi:tRNA(Ile2) C34 agmatinyltransferase TiaS
MSIAMERFGSVGTWANGRSLSRTDLPVTNTTVMTTRECHYCGFTRLGLAGAGYRCPKCGGDAWERHTTRHAAPPREERSSVIRELGHALSRRRRAVHG